ncbi:MAG TPA: PUA domain-containing protein [Candidatus Bathyarchaeia archaeon]|nr:PUA domain-containing protein [Candidatus Bathyarchaeia archaeon]
MEIIRRHAIRKSDLKQIKEKLAESIGDEANTLFSRTAELILTDIGELYAENRIVLAFKIDDKILPSLRALNEGLAHLPTITIDMGAIPHVTNGADIMAPGITKVTPGLKVGDYVVIIDQNYGKSLAIGQLLVSSDEILKNKKGKVIKNYHYVNDPIWSVTL